MNRITCKKCGVSKPRGQKKAAEAKPTKVGKLKKELQDQVNAANDALEVSQGAESIVKARLIALLEAYDDIGVIVDSIRFTYEKTGDGSLKPTAHISVQRMETIVL